ncbi:MAG: AAA family ATPase, partial [Bacteroidota bacterium]
MRLRQLEIKGFKSFANQTIVNFDEDVIGIVGPNGSGKSNILDSLLFCLGLSGSKGMRADRLPDLVNNAQAKKNSRSTIEA